MHPVRRRLVPALALTAALLVATPLVADAHVRVIPDTTASGAYSKLTFRVPNESPTAGTVAVRVQLPADHPFLFVATTAVPGWTVSAPETALPTPVTIDGTTVTKAVQSVTWTADPGTQVGPGQFAELSVLAGPLPAPGELQLPTTQTYSDGTVVSWDEVTPASGQEPEHPAPALTVTAAAADSHSPAADGTHAAAASEASTGSDAGAPWWLTAVALAVAVVALVLSALTMRRPRGSA